MNTQPFSDYLLRFWTDLNGDKRLLNNVEKKGPEQVLPSVFNVTAFATASIGSALVAAAELKKVRTSGRINFPEVEISSNEACAAFKGDSLFQPLGWQLPSAWDPFAGDYICKDGWIRLHTNYSYHRNAVFKILGKAESKDELSEKVKVFEGNKLETDVVNVGGCAAEMRTQKEWEAHPHGIYASQQKIISFSAPCSAKARFNEIQKATSALEGIRVLDITRVIAGPTCTKFLSAHGATVLRLDPFGFNEVAALLPETTVGKRKAFLDFTSPAGRAQFEKLVREAHVLVSGLRPDALLKMGWSNEYLKSLNPSLVIASLNAYGWEGPWQMRRGFDSLVQMSSGIAAEGTRLKRSETPSPLPVQALDYGTGYLLAAGVCRSLSELYQNGIVNEVRSSLVGASNVLQLHPGDLEIPSPALDYFKSTFIEDLTYWGKSFRVFSPGTIDGVRGAWKIMAGPLGRDAPTFQ